MCIWCIWAKCPLDRNVWRNPLEILGSGIRWEKCTIFNNFKWNDRQTCILILRCIYINIWKFLNLASNLDIKEIIFFPTLLLSAICLRARYSASRIVRTESIPFISILWHSFQTYQRMLIKAKQRKLILAINSRSSPIARS